VNIPTASMRLRIICDPPSGLAGHQVPSARVVPPEGEGESAILRLVARRYR
jgi:hypothetical protein